MYPKLRVEIGYSKVIGYQIMDTLLIISIRWNETTVMVIFYYFFVYNIFQYIPKGEVVVALYLMINHYVFVGFYMFVGKYLSCLRLRYIIVFINKINYKWIRIIYIWISK